MPQSTRFVLTSDLEAGTNKLIIVLHDMQVMSSDVMEVEDGMKSTDFICEYNKRVSRLINNLHEYLVARGLSNDVGNVVSQD